MDFCSVQNFEYSLCKQAIRKNENDFDFIVNFFWFVAELWSNRFENQSNQYHFLVEYISADCGPICISLNIHMPKADE